LHEQINQLSALVNQQAASINRLRRQMDVLAGKLECVSRSGNDLYFTGCNVHIVSGSGATDGTTNGLGNLFIGYNEPYPGQNLDRSGSHNLVIGPFHAYGSYWSYPGPVEGLGLESQV
jgi:hypothetical protein